jgi:Nucleotide-diphospho-sugar transferase
MNAIFTISANNYMALALTLCDSIRASGSSAEVFVFLADEADPSLDYAKPNVTMIQAKDLGIECFADMTFKYDVVELNTAIKPFCMAYLMEKGYDKVLYIDPDMSFYQSPDELFEMLEGYDAMVTPHLLDMSKDESGAMEPSEFLFSGVFNMGFFGIRCSELSQSYVEWWKHKLSYACFHDRADGLFTDQKWMEFAPIFFGDRLRIIQEPQYNLAWWNFHERRVTRDPGGFKVQSATGVFPLVLMHFSGYDTTRTDVANRRVEKNEDLRLVEKSALYDLFAGYRSAVRQNRHEQFRSKPYQYDRFENGDKITKFHRRLYRRLTERRTVYQYEDEYQRAMRDVISKADLTFSDPFSCGPGSFWELLKINHLLVPRSSGSVDQINLDVDSKSYVKKTAIMTALMRGAQKVLGLDRYLLLMRFLGKYARDEMQTFLITSWPKSPAPPSKGEE